MRREDTLSTTEGPVPAHFCDVATWARANNVGIDFTYECLRREIDPLPHLRIGRKYVVDDELAVAWLRRNYGVGADTA